MEATRQDELTALCRTCGTCCTGAMFDVVALRPGEPSPTIRHRLRVLQDGSMFELPCPALGDAGCTVYLERPTRCRTYTCELYQRHEQLGGDLETKLQVVRAVRKLADRVMAHAPGKSVTEISARLMQDGSHEHNELRLDLIELSMRLHRDFGWGPLIPEEP